MKKGLLKGIAQYLFLLTLLIGLVGLEACRHKQTITNLPVGVSAAEVTAWYQAVGANEFASDTINNATKLVDDLHVTRLPNGHVVIGGDDYLSTQTALGRTAQAGKRITALLKASPQHFGESTKAQVNVLLDEAIGQLKIANTQGLTGIGDPDKANQYNDLITSIQGSLQTLRLLAAVKGAN